MKKQINPTKTQGFTILELLIAILISSIAISAAFFVYQNLKVYSIQFETNNKKLLSVRSFITLVQSEFDRSKLIRVYDNHIIFGKEKNSEVTIYSNYCIKQLDLYTDTIYFDINNMTAFYKSRVVKKGVIDELRIQTPVANELSEIVFYKKYNLFQKNKIENQKK